MCRITFRKLGLTRWALVDCDVSEKSIDVAIEVAEQAFGWTFGEMERCLRWERDFGELEEIAG
jgi:hypothetical protein